MTESVAFFPWLDCTGAVQIGPLRLLPFAPKKLPGDQLHATQKQIDTVLKTYGDRPRKRIERATLVEIDDWKTGQDPDQGTIARLFQAKEALNFGALANRRLFYNHPDYCNSDNFVLVVQGFSQSAFGSFSYNTRRRDGKVQNMWAADDFAFQRPLHVFNAQISFDEKLVRVLLETQNQAWLDAITEFNLANTDSGDVAIHNEMVMMKSAFERLLAIGADSNDFSRALNDVFNSVPRTPATVGPLREKWLHTRKGTPSLLDCWAYEFCARRGVAAHGNDRRKPSFVWPEESHLAFASILFPLVFKAKAADDGAYQITQDDTDRITRLEHYIAHEPFVYMPSVRDYRKHPWALIEAKVNEAAIMRRLGEDF